MSYARSAVTRMTLDMSRPDLQRSETVTLGDTNRRWEVTLINGGAPFRLPPNWTAALTGIKPDGNGLQNGCSVVDGKIIYDFAAGKEIATCVGSYPVQFDIWDEVGELVASPKVYVNVLADVRPHEELKSEGQYTLIGDAIKKITDMEKDVDLLADTALAQGDEITALKEKITTAGTITIPASEWTDTLPKLAYPEQPVLVKGTVALLMPSNTASQIAARKAKITVQAEPCKSGNIIVQREDGEAPTENITLDYIIIKVDNPEAPPKAALIGVDAYGEGGGGTGSGVDEDAVKKIINSLLGNVANVRQYSADNPPPYPVTSINGKKGAVTLSVPSKASDINAEEAGAVSTHNADKTAHPYLSGRVATALDRISGLDTNIEEINTSVAERLKTADLAAKLDAYKAAQGLVSNTTRNLTNYYLKSEIYTKEEVAALISAIPKFEIKVVTSLPTSNISLTTVYLVKDTTEGGGLYTEYIYVNGAWEELGSQNLDLSGYVTDEELDNLLKSYATLTKVSELIADALKPYATDEEVAEAIRVATVNLVTGSQVTTAINEALKSYYTSAQVDAQIAAQIKTALAGYVPKEDGKGLSTNDYTDSDKAAVTKAAEDSAAALARAETAERHASDAAASAAEVQRRVESGELDGQDGYTPVAGVDYPTDAQFDAKIAAALAERNQLEPIVAESVDWLNENGDPTKIYIVPNADGQGGKVYAYAEKTIVTEPEQPETPADVNVLEGMTLRVGRYGSSGSWSDAGAYATHRTTELIPCDDDDRITIENWLGGSASMYISFFDASKAWIGKLDLVRNEKTNQFSTAATTANSWADKTNYTYSATTATSKPLSEALGKTGIAYFTVCSSDATVDSNNQAINGYAIYVNKGSGSSGEPTIEVVPDWYVLTDFIPTNDARIDELNRAVSVLDTANTALKRRVDALEENGVTSGGATTISKAQALLKIRNWDKPIYERLTPFLLDEDLAVDTTYPKTYTDSADPDGSKRRVNVQAVYDEYNALCTAHPDFVRDITNVKHGLVGATETTFGGLCSDGIQYVRVYEFCEREGRHSNTTVADNWSETKPTFVIVTGIHWEYNGVYSMLYALKEITENPELRDMRRNCRFIVIPMSNPYSFTAYQASGGGHYNANGVEIHNNFAVDFNNAIDATHGTAPLTEVETRYIDNALRKYRDTAVCLLSCHSNASKGANFIWGSVATKFMCNVSMRLVDLMSNAWDVKYDGTDGNYNYRELIDANKSNGSNPQDDGDYRCGFASLSTSSGTEAKQATLYGVQGINVEVYEYFYPFDPNGTDKLLAYSRGAETYINLLRLLAVTYDHNDRDKYAPKPAYEIEE